MPARAFSFIRRWHGPGLDGRLSHGGGAGLLGRRFGEVSQITVELTGFCHTTVPRSLSAVLRVFLHPDLPALSVNVLPAIRAPMAVSPYLVIRRDRSRGDPGINK